MKTLIFIALLFSVTVVARGELPPEPIPNVASLPSTYPDSWVFMHDANFSALIAGKVAIVDVAAQNREYKGAIDAAQFATFIESKFRHELYVAETFYSRGTHGKRTDVLTVYDKSNLRRIAELVLPGGKRGQVVSNKYAMQLIDNDKYLLIFNFTPVASITVIDTTSRKILNEVQIPGCSLIYPTGPRGFSSLCGNGSLMSLQLGKNGDIAAQQRLPVFFSVDDDPLFDKPAYLNGVAYFPTFKGEMQPINVSKNTPVIHKPWSLLDDRGRKENWRPSGWQIISAHASGHLYVLMQKNGHNGSHKSGGAEVWVFDIKSKKKIREIKLKNPGFSIEITSGKEPYLVVTNVAMTVDIYSPEGRWIRDITVGAMPITLHTMR